VLGVLVVVVGGLPFWRRPRIPGAGAAHAGAMLRIPGRGRASLAAHPGAMLRAAARPAGHSASLQPQPRSRQPAAGELSPF